MITAESRFYLTASCHQRSNLIRRELFYPGRRTSTFASFALLLWVGLVVKFSRSEPGR